LYSKGKGNNKFFKGIGSQDDLFEGRKIKSVFFMNAESFHNIWLVFCGENYKFWLAFMKSLTNSENPSSNPLQEACTISQVVACNSKSCDGSWL
jgi:hypothetical protein